MAVSSHNFRHWIAGALALVTLASGCGSEPESALPVRPGPRTATSFTVPHVQAFVDAVPEVDAELRRRVYSLPASPNGRRSARSPAPALCG